MNQHVVVIEDHPFQLNVMGMVLKSLGMENVQPFECGYKALEFIEASSVDLILCDLNMPMIDGIELLKRLAEADFQGNIIITSAEYNNNNNTSCAVHQDYKYYISTDAMRTD